MVGRDRCYQVPDPAGVVVLPRSPAQRQAAVCSVPVREEAIARETGAGLSGYMEGVGLFLEIQKPLRSKPDSRLVRICRI